MALPHENGRHSASPNREAATGEPQTSPVERAWADHFAELWEYALNYVEVRKDELRAQSQKIVLKAVLGILAGVACATAVVVAVALALIGLSDLIGSLLGGRFWAGKLIVGFGLIAAIAAVIVVYKSRYLRSLRTKTLEKYEHRHQLQRQRFGRDVDGNHPR